MSPRNLVLRVALFSNSYLPSTTTMPRLQSFSKKIIWKTLLLSSEPKLVHSSNCLLCKLFICKSLKRVNKKRFHFNFVKRFIENIWIGLIFKFHKLCSWTRCIRNSWKQYKLSIKSKAVCRNENVSVLQSTFCITRKLTVSHVKLSAQIRLYAA